MTFPLTSNISPNQSLPSDLSSSFGKSPALRSYLKAGQLGRRFQTFVIYQKKKKKDDISNLAHDELTYEFLKA